MKKLLVLALVLGLASIAMAVPVLRVDPADQKNDYSPSDWITIQLYSPTTDLAIVSVTIDAITDNPGGPAKGLANEPQIFNPNYGTQFPGVLNDSGLLVKYMGASDTTIPARGATGVLYSFEYHVPNVPFSTMISITTWDDGELGNYYPAAIVYKNGQEVDGTIGMTTPIHVIPEPATIALLGLGGLLLRRKK